MAHNQKVELLKRVPLFADCSRGELQQIAQIADEIDLAEGKDLTRLGDSGREFFVLLEGEADVSRDGEIINSSARVTSSARSRWSRTRLGQPP